MVQDDRVRLYQLFFNRVDNAIKYSPEGYVISVSLHKEEYWAIVKVRDDGIGKAAEHLPYIFERFYRVEKDHVRKTGGSRLGLAICKLMAELHRGTIEIERVVEQGSVFTVKLPILKMEA